MNLLPEIADQKLIETRMIICQGCKFRKDSPFIGSTCGTLLMPSNEKGKETCGCALNLKWKLLNYHCPQIKW